MNTNEYNWIIHLSPGLIVVIGPTRYQLFYIHCTKSHSSINRSIDNHEQCNSFECNLEYSRRHCSEENAAFQSVARDTRQQNQIRMMKNKASLCFLFRKTKN